jgi:hypothetical protein
MSHTHFGPFTSLVEALPDLASASVNVARADIEPFVEYESDSEMVTLTLRHVDWEEYRHAMRELKSAIKKATG